MDPQDNKDIDPPLPDDNTDLVEIEKDIDESQEDIHAIESVYAFGLSYSAHPMDPCLNFYGVKTGYLATSAMALYGMEALSEDTVQMAQEGLVDTLKSKIGGWISKIGPTLVNTGKVIWNFVTRQINKITSMVGEGFTKVKSTVRAHPFATVLTTVTACLGLGAVVPTMMRSIPGIMGTVGRLGAGAAAEAPNAATTAASVGGRLNGMVSRIKWPWGKLSIKTKGTNIGLDVADKVDMAAKSSKSSAVLGWTKDSMIAIKDKLMGVKAFAPNLTKMAQDQFTKEVTDVKSLWSNKKYLHLVGSLGLKAMVYIPFLKLGWEVIKAAFNLIKEILWGTFRIVAHTFAALTGQSADDDIEVSKKVTQDAGASNG